MSGLQNARNLNGLGLLVCFLVFMASFAIAFIPSRDADPVHVRAARVVVVVTGIGTWLLFKRAQRLRPSEADQPPLDEGGTASEDMASPLEDLGVPLDGSVTDPQTALMGGVVKAGLYQAQLSLEAGDPDGALSILESLLEPAVGLEVPGLSEAHGVAFFLKGQALEKKGLADGAVGAYRRALEIHPEHEEARRALERLGV